MKNQPNAAMENGFTAQLMKSVMPIPRRCLPTCPSAAKSTLSSIGITINQIRAATGRLTFAISAEPDSQEHARHDTAERDADA